MKLSLTIAMVITILSCFGSIGYGLEERKAMRNAITKIGCRLSALEMEIKEGRVKLETNIYKRLKQVLKHKEPFTSLLQGIAYTDKELCDKLDGTVKSEDFLELAMKLNHLKSLWYKFAHIQFLKRLENSFCKKKTDYALATKIANNCFKKHDRIYRHYKGVLESSLRVEEITCWVPNLDYDRKDGIRYQYVPDMVAATNDLKLRVEELQKNIQQNEASSNTISLVTAKKHWTATLQQEDWMPNRIEYTARHLSELPDKHPRSKEYLDFGSAYHKYKHLHYKLRTIVFNQLPQEKAYSYYKDHVPLFQKLDEKHVVLHEKYKTGLDNHQDSIPSLDTNLNTSHQQDHRKKVIVDNHSCLTSTCDLRIGEEIVLDGGHILSIYEEPARKKKAQITDSLQQPGGSSMAFSSKAEAAKRKKDQIRTASLKTKLISDLFFCDVHVSSSPTSLNEFKGIVGDKGGISSMKEKTSYPGIQDLLPSNSFGADVSVGSQLNANSNGHGGSMRNPSSVQIIESGDKRACIEGRL